MRMPFGKYRGRELEEIPESYLLWVLDNAEHASETLREEIKCRLDIGVQKPTPGVALDAVTAVVAAWHRKVIFRWHPDRGGDTRVAQAINDACDQLRNMLAEEIGPSGGRRA